MLPCINGKKKMYKVDKKLIQKFVLMEEIPDGEWTGFYYEFTVTFNPSYWMKESTFYAVPQVIADVIKPIMRDVEYASWRLRYSVEYHQNGYPHIHGQVVSNVTISPDIQRCLHQRLCRRYGKSQWYQTEDRDKYHEASGMRWSRYIQKDVEKNEEGEAGRHYFCYKFLRL